MCDAAQSAAIRLLRFFASQASEGLLANGRILDEVDGLAQPPFAVGIVVRGGRLGRSLL